MSLLRKRIDEQLFRQVDASSLVVFRASFGLIMLVEVLRFFSKGWIERMFIEPNVLFKYYGFEWVEPLPGAWMYLVFAVTALAALCVMIGFLYRFASVVLVVAFGYVFLLDMARYLNHFYLVLLIAFLLVFVPANRTWAVDAWVRPRIRSETVPGWAIWIFRLQFEIVLLYAGLVKLNPDWINLEPMGMWLARRSDFPIVGQFFMQEWAAFVSSWGVIALHLIGAPLLLFRRSRRYAIGAYVLFHLMNFVMFRIGIFPWLTIAATFLFLGPGWPRQLVARLQHTEAPGVVPEGSPQRGSRVVITLMGIWLGLQVLLPLRHFLYPGYSLWTEEGQKFAWQMKLHDKIGDPVFLVKNPVTGEVQRIRPEERLSEYQVGRFHGKPELILQFAHLLAREAEARGIENVEVRAQVCVSLNGRKEAWLIDPDRDLARVRRSIWPSDWILPLKHPPERPPHPRGRANLRCEPPAS